jgi:hypothetical protein
MQLTNKQKTAIRFAIILILLYLCGLAQDQYNM